MTDYKSRLYLDVDGVLNPASTPDSGHPGERLKGDVRINRGGGFVQKFHMVWVPHVINTLDALREEHNAELVWLSSWNEDHWINRLPPLWGGLADGRILPWAGSYETFQTARERSAWKSQALLADQDSDPLPFLWADDEAVKFHGPAVQEVHPNAVLLDVHEGKGLSVMDLITISAFVKAASQY